MKVVGLAILGYKRTINKDTKLDYKLASWIDLWGLGFMVETQLSKRSFSRFLQTNRKRRGRTNEMLQKKLLETSSRRSSRTKYFMKKEKPIQSTDRLVCKSLSLKSL
jgi:hypothetical protein